MPVNYIYLILCNENIKYDFHKIDKCNAGADLKKVNSSAKVNSITI